MKLVRMELENFRRHRRTAWEVPDGLIAVVGPNGAGKSTLIEALTFALYGAKQSGRKDLIRSTSAGPADSVRVAVDLELAGQAIRIVRELRGRAQNPIASVTVDGALVVQPVTGSNEQATAWLQRRLGLDADGFLHTVVARQKEVDRLGRLTPAERRAFILDLVGISAVDDAVRRARDARSQRRARLDEARRAVGPPGAAVARCAASEQARAAAAAAAEAASEVADAAARRAAAAEAAAAAVQARQGERVIAAQEAQTARFTAQRAADEHARSLVVLASAEAAAARSQALASEVAALPALEAESRQADEARRLAAERQRQLENVAHERRGLNAARAALEAIVVQAAPDLAALETAAAAAAEEAANGRQALRDTQGELRALRERNGRFVALGGAATCPTCAQPLSADHLAAAHGEASRHVAELTAKEDALRRRAAAADAVAEAQARALAAARRLSEEAAIAARRREHEAARVGALEDVVRRLEASLDPDVASTAPAPDLQPALQRARQARDETLRLAQTVAGLPDARRRRDEASAQFALAQAAAQRAEATLAALPDLLAEDNAARRALADARQAAVLASAAKVERVVSLAHAERDAREAAAELAREQDARRRCADLEKDLALWTALVGTAGDGLLERFREHLVARTAPLIQEEASRLLAAFTGGRYTDLVLESDYGVYILDDGLRYELDRFSGGEQDLVHLALRLATSRLLATRANAPELRFLALDEVFGGLDAGRQRTLLDGLQGLSGLYGQVLCITHDETVRDGLDHVVRVELADGEARLTPG
ncbi:MAG: SMC family ATPase [bacterium]